MSTLAAERMSVVKYEAAIEPALTLICQATNASQWRHHGSSFFSSSPLFGDPAATQGASLGDM